MPLELQTSGIHPESQYVLDGSIELGEIDAGSAVIIEMYGDRRMLDTVVDNAAARRIGRELLSFADDIFRRIDDQDDRDAITAMGLLHARHMTGEIARCAAEWAIADMVEGGCERYFRDEIRARRDGITPLKRDLRRLKSADWIKRYLKRNDELVRNRQRVRHVLDRNGSIPSKETMVDGVSRLFEKIAAYRRQTMERQQRQWQAAREAIAGGTEFRDIARNPAKTKAGIRAYRKRVRRAAATASSFLGPEAVSRFARGEMVIMKGQNLSFGVKSSGLLGGLGHGQINLTALDTGSEKPLANLCLFFPNTPALDQLTAIKLHLDAGMEQEIVQDANILGLTAEGVGHPLLLRKKAEQEERYRQTEEGRMGSSLALRRARDVAYFEHTKHLWVPIAEIFALGEKVRKQMPPPRAV